MRLEPGSPGRRSGATLDFDVGRSSEGAEPFPGEKECADFEAVHLCDCSVHFGILFLIFRDPCFIFEREPIGEATKFDF